MRRYVTQAVRRQLAFGAQNEVGILKRLNVHGHLQALDGGYVQSEEALVFLPLEAITEEDVRCVAERSWKRIEAILRKHGRSLDEDMVLQDPVGDELRCAANNRYEAEQVSWGAFMQRKVWSNGVTEHSVAYAMHDCQRRRRKSTQYPCLDCASRVSG